MNKPMGIILYKGKSQIDGKLIVAIATGFKDESENKKTGAMIPVCIIRPDMPPIVAKKLGYDYSVCGNCKHRDFNSCYVNLCHGPENIFKAYHNDKYVSFKPEHLELFKDKMIRLGSYGDPSAIPIEIWDNICKVAQGFTGYTHAWGAKYVSPDLKKYCMASCDSLAEQIKAEAMGWRTFRIRGVDEVLKENEFVCPASTEAGAKTTCSKCKACMGISSHTHKNPCIIVHGADFKIDKFLAGMKKIKYKRQYRVDFKKRYANMTAIEV